MAKIRTIQIYRGTTAQNDAYTGSAGELTMDTTTNELRLHDGSTAGGHVIGSGGGGSGYHPDLFSVKWSDHQINDIQWLRGDTFSWQDGSVYEAAYNHLADDIDGKTLQSETIAGTTIQFYLADDGHKICPDTEESNVAAIYTATGVAWYYIIDTTNERFKLPRTKFGVTGLRDIVGKYVAAGLPNVDAKLGGYFQGSGGATPTEVSNVKFVANASGTSYAASYPSSTSKTAEIDMSLTSDIYGNGTTVQPPATQMCLYFYVGQFTQTALENTAGLNASLFNAKADIDLTNAVSNASATAKEAITTWGLPDYSAGVSLINTASYKNTITTKGFVLFNAEFTSGNDKAFVKKGSNGTPYQTAACHNYSNTYYDGSHDIVPVDVGDIVYNESGLITMTFFPCKGV